MTDTFGDNAGAAYPVTDTSNTGKPMTNSFNHAPLRGFDATTGQPIEIPFNGHITISGYVLPRCTHVTLPAGEIQLSGPIYIHNDSTICGAIAAGA